MITEIQAELLRRQQEHDVLSAEDADLAARYMSVTHQLSATKGQPRDRLISELSIILKQRAALKPRLFEANRNREHANMSYWNEKKTMETGAPITVAESYTPPVINEAQMQHLEALALKIRNTDLKMSARVATMTEFLNMAMPILKKAGGK